MKLARLVVVGLLLSSFWVLAFPYEVDLVLAVLSLAAALLLQPSRFFVAALSVTFTIVLVCALFPVIDRYLASGIAHFTQPEMYGDGTRYRTNFNHTYVLAHGDLGLLSEQVRRERF